MMSADPILDVLRGISTVASFSIAVSQVRQVWTDIFTGTCSHCHGAGSVICPRCSGTKDRRSRPAAISVARLGFVDGPESHHPCLWCGPNGPNDFEEEITDDEERAWAVRDDLQLAMVNRPRKSKPWVLAGTVPCPECKGAGEYKRHTPNFVRFFGLQEPWQFEVAQRLSNMYVGQENRPPQRRRQMLEYAGAPPPRAPRWIDEVMEKEDDENELAAELEAAAGEVPEARAKLGDVMTGEDQLTADDYIIPYVDDEDSEQEF